MADVNQVITLGIGTPSDIEHFILFGLNGAEADDSIAGPGNLALVSPSKLRTTQPDAVETVKPKSIRNIGV